MSQLPVTRASLLARLGDPADADAWKEFVGLYAELIYGFARKRGLQDADAADLMQDVLRSVVGHAGTFAYDRSKGSFRGWLFTVTRNRVFNFLDAARRRPAANGDTAAHQRLAETPAPDEQDAWDREYRQRAFAWAADRVKGEFQDATWKAFWLTAVDGKAPKDAAAATGLSVGAVYVAKSRVLARLREEVQQLDDE